MHTCPAPESSTPATTPSNIENIGDITLVLMAAGSSSRFTQGFTSTESAIKKQWLRVDSRPLWLFLADVLAQTYPFARICITASAQDLAYMRKLCAYDIIRGGESRQDSLQNALESIHTPWVLVSDVARAGIVRDPHQIITRLIAALEHPKSTGAHSAQSAIDCVVPYLPVADTATYQGAHIDRQALRRIQTPQLSRVSTLKSALAKSLHDQGTDESSIIAAHGGRVAYVLGDSALEKLTFTSDMAQLENLLAPYLTTPASQPIRPTHPIHQACAQPPIRALPALQSYPIPPIYVGNGLDVHEFMQGGVMKLGGVEIESELSFKAHSDGDVALHSLTDAILGAMGAGDIGEWFPDSSAEFAGADSAKLLAQVWGFARSVGFALCNADLTIIAQTPRLSDYKQPMRARIAEILGVPLACVNVKATTTESLGFVGRKEGICVMSSVALRLVGLSEVAQSIAFSSAHGGACNQYAQ